MCDAHELRVHQPFGDHLAAERETERRVRAGTDAQVEVRLGRGRREGRVDDDQPGTPVDGVEQEVDVRDAGLHGVAADEQQEPAVRPVLRLVLGVLDTERDGHPHGQVAVEVEAGAVGHAQQRAGPVVGALLDVARSGDLAEHVDRLPAPLLTDGPHAVGDQVQGLLPGGLRNRPFPTFPVADEGVQEPIVAVDLVEIAEALHAAPRRIDRVRIVGRLLDLDDDTVPHEGELATAAGAVGGARGAHDAIDQQARLDVVVPPGPRDPGAGGAPCPLPRRRPPPCP